MTLRTFLAGIFAASLLGLAPVAGHGAPLPTLSGHTLQGQVVDLAALRGKVVMLLFWSTDCAVCLDKLPELRTNLAGWRGKDFVVIAVSQDLAARDLADYEKVLDRLVPPDPQMKIVWRRDPQHHDGFGEFPLREPHTVVINRSGDIVKSVHGRFPPELWDDVAELVLN
jgi:peroxiredoxin